MNIHKKINDQVELAKTYALDGAFHSAASILRQLADQVEAHARWADQAVLSPSQTEQLLIAMAGGLVTGDALAAKLGVHVRSIYRYVRALRAAGHNIQSGPGKGAGFILRQPRQNLGAS